MPSPWHYLSRAPMKFRKLFLASPAERLHIGSGPQSLSGWVNIDIVRYPGVDRILDVRRGLPFKDVRFIFAEHFVEHLDLNDAMYLFLECRRVLRDDGVLRLSTPNLDWVWGIALRRCRQQRGSGPRLFQTEWRVSRLLDAGFASVAISGYGESSYAELRASSPASGAASRPTVVSVIKFRSCN